MRKSLRTASNFFEQFLVKININKKKKMCQQLLKWMQNYESFRIQVWNTCVLYFDPVHIQIWKNLLWTLARLSLTTYTILTVITLKFTSSSEIMFNSNHLRSNRPNSSLTEVRLTKFQWRSMHSWSLYKF